MARSICKGPPASLAGITAAKRGRNPWKQTAGKVLRGTFSHANLKPGTHLTVTSILLLGSVHRKYQHQGYEQSAAHFFEKGGVQHKTGEQGARMGVIMSEVRGGVRHVGSVGLRLRAARPTRRQAKEPDICLCVDLGDLISTHHKWQKSRRNPRIRESCEQRC